MNRDPDGVDKFLNDNLTQADCDKMRPEYWEKTAYRRLVARINWDRKVRAARKAERELSDWQMTWTPEQWTAWISEGEWPEKPLTRFQSWRRSVTSIGRIIMKKLHLAVGALILSAGVLVAADLIPVNKPQFTVETGLKDLVKSLQANFNAVNAQLATLSSGSGTYVTNVVVEAGAKTNTIILDGRQVKSWVVTQ